MSLDFPHSPGYQASLLPSSMTSLLSKNHIYYEFVYVFICSLEGYVCMLLLEPSLLHTHFFYYFPSLQLFFYCFLFVFLNLYFFVISQFITYSFPLKSRHYDLNLSDQRYQIYQIKFFLHYFHTKRIRTNKVCFCKEWGMFIIYQEVIQPVLRQRNILFKFLFIV